MDATPPPPVGASGARTLGRSRIGDLIAWPLAGTALAVTAASLLGRLDWRLSLLSHFRLHMTAGCAVLLPLFLMFGRRGPAITLAAALAANLSDILRREAARTAPSDNAAETLAEATLITFNALRRNPDKARALAWLADRPADVAVLVEASPDWRAALANRLAASYPHRAAGPDSQGDRILVLSRHPLRRLGSVALDDQGLLAVEVLKPDLRFILFAVHPDHALERRGLGPQRALLRRLEQLVRQADGPVVVAGDLNTSPWSAEFHRLTARTGLDGPLVREGTFPAGLSWAGLSWAGLPIDHVLTGNGLRLTALEPGPELGSDHRPLRARISLPLCV